MRPFFLCENLQNLRIKKPPDDLISGSSATPAPGELMQELDTLNLLKALRLGKAGQDWREECPIDDLVEARERVSHGVQFFKSHGLIEETAISRLNILGHRSHISAVTPRQRDPRNRGCQHRRDDDRRRPIARPDAPGGAGPRRGTRMGPKNPCFIRAHPWLHTLPIHVFQRPDP